MIIIVKKEKLSRVDKQMWIDADIVAAVSDGRIDVLKNRFGAVGAVQTDEVLQMIEAAILLR